MGDPGPKSFENDAAIDWVSELAESKGYAGVAGALDAVIADKADYLDADVCQEGIAAAEIVAAAAGAPAPELPAEVTGWIKGQAKPDAALIAKAIDVTAAVREKSELREHWEDSDAFAAWNAAMDDLKVRLDVAKSGKAA